MVRKKAKSATECQAARRQKLKVDPAKYEEYLRKQKEYMQKMRKYEWIRED